MEILAEIEHSEISVLCTDKHLGTLSKTAIIVREKITTSAAYEIRGVLSHLMKEGHIHHGLVLVEVVPTNEIASILNDYGYPILALYDLISDLYDFRSAMNKYVLDYEKKEIFMGHQGVSKKTVCKTSCRGSS